MAGRVVRGFGILPAARALLLQGSTVLSSVETMIAFIIIIGVVLYPLSLPAPDEERT